MNYKNSVLEIINASIKGKKIAKPIDTKDKKLLFLLKEQTFLPMLYYVTNDDSVKHYYLSSCLIHEEFDKIKATLKKLFDENDINHIFLKGSSLQFLYPDRNIRLLGDIDILIQNKDIKKATKLLKQSGFTYQDRASHHIGFDYHGFEIELHFNIIEYHLSISKYFTKPFENAYQVDKNTYELNPEYNLIFIISHYMKHLKGGSGLRSLCDIYLMITKYNINLNKIREVFVKYGYEKFYDCLLTTLDIIFDYHEYPYKKNEHANDLITYSLKSGIHGYGKYNTFNVNKQKSNSNNKFIYLLKTWFVPLKALFAYYPWTKSIILIPIGYIVRLFHLIFKRQKELKDVLKNKNNNSDIFKNIGLK